MAKLSPTLHKSLHIDAAALRDSYAQEEMRFLGWIPGHQNHADGLKKDRLLSGEHPLKMPMSTNKLAVDPERWAHADCRDLGT